LKRLDLHWGKTKLWPRSRSSCLCSLSSGRNDRKLLTICVVSAKNEF